MSESTVMIILSVALLVAALRVVTSRNLVHGVLWLGLALVVTAFVFVVLRAPFIAGIQILLYTGGVITLMLFGVMLTRRHADLGAYNGSSRQGLGGITAVGLFALFASAISMMDPDALPSTRGDAVPPEAIARAFLTDHLMAFEVLSVLLLAVMIGAIVLGRKTDHGAPGGPRIPTLDDAKSTPDPEATS